MSKDEKPVPPADPTDPFAFLGKGIPIKLIKFHKAIDVPGRQVADNISMHNQVNRENWSVSYHPTAQAFKVTYHRPGSVSESCVVERSVVSTWIPAPL